MGVRREASSMDYILLKEQLCTEISLKREKLIKIAELKGLTSSETIQISQELDMLLNTYQRLMLKKTQYFITNVSNSKFVNDSILQTIEK